MRAERVDSAGRGRGTIRYHYVFHKFPIKIDQKRVISNSTSQSRVPNDKDKTPEKSNGQRTEQKRKKYKTKSQILCKYGRYCCQKTLG